MVGGGTGPTTGSKATLATPGSWWTARMLESVEPWPINVLLLARGNTVSPDALWEVDVGAGASLVVRDVSATLALPGPRAERSYSRVVVRVGQNATLAWLPEPLIAASGCDHQASMHVSLEPGARLLLREELLLGRYAEEPGTVRQRLRVCLGDQPLHNQELSVGPAVAGWPGPAVTDGRRALGSLLVIDPHRYADLRTRPPSTAGSDAARFQLTETAVLLSVLADDGFRLRQRLDAGLAELEVADDGGCLR